MCSQKDRPGSTPHHTTPHIHTQTRVNERWKKNKQITKTGEVRGRRSSGDRSPPSYTHVHDWRLFMTLWTGNRTLKLLLRQLIGQRIKLVLGRFVCHSQSSDSDSVWDSVLTEKSTVLSAQTSAAPWKLESGETSLLRCGLALLYLLSLADPTKKGIHRIWEICLSRRHLCE